MKVTGRWRFAAALVAVGVVLAASLHLRSRWIAARIARLDAPPARDFTRENAALPAKNGRLRIVLIGDSTASRWPAASFDPGWEVVNRGVGGETVAQTAARFEADALNLAPDVIVVSAGLNDLVAAGFLTPPQRDETRGRIAGALLAMAHRGAQHGVRTMAATLVPPSRPDWLRLPVWQEDLRDGVALTNAELRRHAAEAEIVDFAAALESGDRRTPDGFRRDTLHLNAAGYARLTEALGAALRRDRRAP